MSHARRTTVPRVLRALSATYGILATAALVTVWLFGDESAATYLIGLTYFWWLCPAPAVLVLALAARARWAVVAVIAPAVLTLYWFGPYAVHAVRTGSRAPSDLRVATYNVSNGRPLDGLVRLVAEHRPDVLLLQEVTAGRERLATLLPQYPYASVGRHGPDHDGYAVLSRFPIRSVVAVTGLPSGARPADLVTVEVGGRSVVLLSAHLASPCIGCPPGAPNAAGDTGEAARVRVAEARRYAQVLSTFVRRREPVIAGADLNASPLNRPLGELTGIGLVDTQRAVGTDLGFTRGPGPGIARVDYVLVEGFDVLRVTDGARGSSSHSPVIADLAWPRGHASGRSRS